MDNFETGSYKDVNDALTTANSNLEAATESDAGYADLVAAAEKAQKNADRAEQEFFQLSEEYYRAENQLSRESEKENMNSRLNDARGNEAYFLDVIEYYNAKLNFFATVEEALDLSRDEDYEFYMEIQPEKERLWEMLGSLNNQLVDV